MAEKKSFEERPFMKYGTLVFDMMLMSLLWAFVGCLGTFMVVAGIGAYLEQEWVKSTIGMLFFGLTFILEAPATCAMYYTWGKRQRDKDGYISRDFFHGYKTGFLKSTLMALIIRILIVVLCSLMLIEGQSYEAFGSFGLVLIVVQLFLVIVLLLTDTVIIPLVARFDLPVKMYFKFGLGMGIKHLPTAFLCLIMQLLVIVLGFFFPVSLILLPGLSGYFQTALFERVFRKYLPKHETVEAPEEEESGEEELEEEMDPERKAIIERYKNQSGQ